MVSESERSTSEVPELTKEHWNEVLDKINEQENQDIYRKIRVTGLFITSDNYVNPEDYLGSRHWRLISELPDTVVKAHTWKNRLPGHSPQYVVDQNLVLDQARSIAKSISELYRTLDDFFSKEKSPGARIWWDGRHWMKKRIWVGLRSRYPDLILNKDAAKRIREYIFDSERHHIADLDSYYHMWLLERDQTFDILKPSTLKSLGSKLEEDLLIHRLTVYYPDYRQTRGWEKRYG